MQGSSNGDSAGVERRVTEPLLRDFLALLGEIQEEINSRWNGQKSSVRHVDHARWAHAHE